MNLYSDHLFYAYDWFKNRHLISHLFWYKKNKGIQWIFGQNFGDYLSTVIVSKAAKANKLSKMKALNNKLLSIGSILHFAETNDIIWGSGINGKISVDWHRFAFLDVRLVRGPITQEFLANKNISVPSIYGDPGLLLPILFPEFAWRPIKNKIIAIPNLNEIDICRSQVPQYIKFVSPMSYWKKVVNEILTSELVLSSSLHGIIIAEAFGVPVRFVSPVGGETMLKYKDYYLGTGRKIISIPSTFQDKITHKSGLAISKISYDSKKILSTFPKDCFE